MWEYFLIGWTCFVLHYYSNLPKNIRKIIRAFTEE